MQEKATCFLCDSPAERSRADQGFEERWYYECSSDDCGNYLSAQKVIRQLDVNPDKKQFYCIEAAPPSVCAEVIYEAATDGTDKIRYTAGYDAEAFLAMRTGKTDEEYIAFIKQQFGL